MTDLFRFQKELRDQGYTQVCKEDHENGTYYLEGNAGESKVVTHEGTEIKAYIFDANGKNTNVCDVVEIKRGKKESYDPNDE